MMISVLKSSGTTCVNKMSRKYTVSLYIYWITNIYHTQNVPLHLSALVTMYNDPTGTR